MQLRIVYSGRKSVDLVRVTSGGSSELSKCRAIRGGPSSHTRQLLELNLGFIIMLPAIVLPFPQTQEPHFATVRDKTRNSGLTSVCFFEHVKVICADFNEKAAYLASVRDGDLDILDQVPTQIADGTPVQTDLMDRQGDRFVVSNFYQGSVSFYRSRVTRSVLNAR